MHQLEAQAKEQRNQQKRQAAKPRLRLARPLAEAMWAGFGTCAARELEAIESDRERHVREVAEASRALSRWYAFIGQHERALYSFRTRRSTSPTGENDVRQLVLEAETLLRLGRFDEAKALVHQAIGRLGELPELCFSAANTVACGDEVAQFDLDRQKLEWFNKPLLSGGLAPLELRDSRLPLSLDNIFAQSAARDSCGVKVSVLMPAYNAERTIATAIESVLSQTWSDLELVIVDDGSRDGTWSVIQSYATRDSRVVALRHPSNRGAYPARNTALAAATGELVTVQDSDDWSHPQRLSLQASDLLQEGQSVNTTDLIRVDRHLYVRINRNGSVLGENYSSLMTRREAIASLGGWDECKMGADSELYARFLLKHGAARNVVRRTIPLCLAAVRDDSLTGRPDIGLNTFHYGPRREHKEAYEHWHRREAEKKPTDLFKLPADRRFPIPSLCKLGPQQDLTFDVLFVSDFAHHGDATNTSMLRAARALGLRCGCFHWPRLLNAGAAIASGIRQLLHEGVADSVVAGETVASRLVVVSDPIVLEHMPDKLPIVRAENCVILATEALIQLSKGRPRSRAAERIINNAHAAFAVKPLLAPNSADIRRTLVSAGDQQELTTLDWTPLLDIAELQAGDGVTDSAGGRYPLASFAERLKPYLEASPTHDHPKPAAAQPHCGDRRVLDGDDMRTALVVLEYCGGERTDKLVSQLRAWNPGAGIFVLDNASPKNRASCVTHRNNANSYIGGGFIDCIDLARAQGARYLFFCANDIEILDRLNIAEFQSVLDLDAQVVQFSCSVTPDSTQATNFPWMVRRVGGAIRRVRQADLVCCLIRLDFLATFGGFPLSKGGWGYSAELAFHAKLQGKKIYVNDRCTFQHLGRKRAVVTESGETIDKSTEVTSIYSRRYGDWLLPRSALAEPLFDESVDVAEASGNHVDHD